MDALRLALWLFKIVMQYAKCLALQGSILTNKGLNVAKHQHETIIDHMNAALASEQAQQIGIPYRRNPDTLIRDVPSLKTLSRSVIRKISKRPTPQHCPRLSFWTAIIH